MKLTNCLWAVFLLALTFAKGMAWDESKVIYGEDNRVDVHASDNPMFIELAKSTAAMISYQSLVYNRQDTHAAVRAKNMQELGMCAEERFSQQVTAGRCSGFLVAEDLLVTAGHCVRSDFDCKNYAWVFDYKLNPENPQAFKVPVNSIYGCKEIVEHKLDNVSLDDYALIRLNRKVTDRASLEYRKDGTIEKGVPLVVIGHPSGLPTKISDGANVRTITNAAYFVANLDTYGGNSGSAVFDSETGVVEGILVRGEADFEFAPGKNCRISKVCTDEGCRGEDVTRITNIKSLH